MTSMNPSRDAGILDIGFLDGLVDEIVPATLGQWRPLVVEGIAFFLQRLSPRRLISIAAAQAALPEHADAAMRLVSLLAQCPTLHKLGQVLARHRSLSEALREQLQTLETLPPTTPLAEISQVLQEEVPQFPAGLTLGEEALAEGSVAVVLPFTWIESGSRQHGVFKVLKPNIEQHLAEEIAIWTDLAAFLDARGAKLGLPAINYRGTLDDICQLLVNEVHLKEEQRHLQTAAALYAEEPRVLIPRVLPWCSRRVTAMTRVFGARLTDADIAPNQHRILASSLVEILLGQAFWSAEEDAFVHADLHGGNIFLTDDGRIAVLDWSLVTQVPKRHREAIVAIALGGLTLDAQKIGRAVADMGIVAADNRELAAAVEHALDREIWRGELPGFNWLLRLLDDIAMRTSCTFPQDLLLFRKTWFSLAGVIRDIGVASSPDLPLLGIAARRFVGEYSARCMEWPNSRRFATHLSNLDLANLLASLMLVPARYWSRLLVRVDPSAIVNIRVR
ncbi:MAG: hypothetical protein HYS18_04235 [Burkholderiales bacterium]|nr:hypothetical protein [Burkholderiales bacterium]